MSDQPIIGSTVTVIWPCKPWQVPVRRCPSCNARVNPRIGHTCVAAVTEGET